MDPRVVLNPVQARQLLAAVTYVGARRRQDRDRGRRLHAFFACLYYGELRPGEAQGLREGDCSLPAGNSVKVLLTVYAKCLDDQRTTHNERLEALLDG